MKSRVPMEVPPEQWVRGWYFIVRERIGGTKAPTPLFVRETRYCCVR